MKSRLFFSLLVLILAGCAGYKIGPVKPAEFKDIQSIAVPSFKNDTLIPRVEVMAAGTVIKQIQQDGTYQVKSDATADAILEGMITEIRRRPARSVRGNVLATREFTLTVVMNYRLVRRDTGVVLDQNSVEGTTNFFVSADVQQDERQAIPIAMERAVVRLVSLISEGW
jgi:hypothetical protein